MLNRPTRVLFREVQHFRQLWLWFIVLAIAGIAIYSVIQQLVLGRPFGNNPAPDPLVLVIGILFGLALPSLFCVMNLTTEVHEDGLYIRFFPFHLSFHKIVLEDIKEFQARTYSPIKEYGGWGIRYGRKGKAYNVSGNRGMQLKLTNGKQLLIGSQKLEEFAEALAVMMRTTRT